MNFLVQKKVPFLKYGESKRAPCFLGKRIGSNPVSSPKSHFPIFRFFLEIEVEKIPKKADRMRFYTHPIQNMAGLAGFEPA